MIERSGKYRRPRLIKICWGSLWRHRPSSRIFANRTIVEDGILPSKNFSLMRSKMARSPLFVCIGSFQHLFHCFVVIGFCVQIISDFIQTNMVEDGISDGLKNILTPGSVQLDDADSAAVGSFYKDSFSFS